MLKLIIFTAIALILSYGNEYFRFKPFGCWALGHAGMAQLFMPSYGKVRVVEDENKVEEDEGFSVWLYNRAGGPFKPCLIIFGAIFAKDVIYSPFGGIIDNLIWALF